MNENQNTETENFTLSETKAQSDIHLEKEIDKIQLPNTNLNTIKNTNQEKVEIENIINDELQFKYTDEIEEIIKKVNTIE